MEQALSEIVTITLYIVKKSVSQYSSDMYQAREVIFPALITVSLRIFWFDLMSHQHCKGYMVTFQLYWWKKTSGAPSCIISGKRWHPSRTTNIL